MAAFDDKPAELLKRKQQQLASAQAVRVESAIKKASVDSDLRELFWWLLSITRVSGQPFTTNALTTAFNCGELNVGQQVLAKLIEVDPAIYVRMQQEHQNEYQVRVLDAIAERAGNASLDASSGDPGAYDNAAFNDD
jgi:hypothetical protein